MAYAYRYQDQYPDGVYWLNAANDMRVEFAALGRHLLGRGGDATALKARIWETLRAQFSIEEMRDLCLELGVEHEEFSRELGRSVLAREIADYFERRAELPRLEGAIRRLRGELATPQAQDEQIDHAFAWLREHSQSLLILDNLADPAVLDEPLIRNNVLARLLVRLLFTTRRRELGRFRPLELKTLSPDAALKLLLRDPRRAAAFDPDHPEHATARDICATFGYLPLALEIAAAHLAKFPTAPLAAYHDELRQRGALAVMADQRVSVATRHETGLAAALAAQWMTLADEAQRLLRIAGQLPEAAYIPAARLGLLAGVPDIGRSFFDMTLDVALAQLNDASLVEELMGDQVRLHPLVSEFARDQTPLAEKDLFLESCVRRLLSAFGDIETLEQQCDRRGIDALINDLLVAQSLLEGFADRGDQTPTDLRTYLKVLRREAHNLRGWRRDDAPAFLAQQLYLQLFDTKTPTLFDGLADRLRSQGPTLRSCWAARSRLPEIDVTLSGHTTWVVAVAVTPDGQRAISGDGLGTLLVWNLHTGEAELKLSSLQAQAKVVAVSSDGLRAISGGHRGSLFLWNLVTGMVERTLIGHTSWINAVALTLDGQRAISGGDDKTLRIWDLHKGEVERTLTGHEDRVLTVAVTPDGRRAVSGGSDGTLLVWNLDTWEVDRPLFGHVRAVQAVALTQDGRRAISGGSDGTLLVWNLDTGEVKGLTGHKDGVSAVTLIPDGRRAISSSYDGTIRIWDLDTWETERTLTGRNDWMRAVALTPDGRRAVSGGHDLTLHVWNLYPGESTDTGEGRQARGHKGGVWELAVAPNRRWVVTCGEDNTLRVWNLGTGKLERTLTSHERAWVISVTQDGRRAVSDGEDGTLCVWNLYTGEMEQRLKGNAGSVWAVDLTPSGHRAVSGGDRSLRVWNLDTGKLERTLTGHRRTVSAVVLTRDGHQAISGDDDGVLRVWNLDTGEMERILIGHTDRVNSIAVTPDGLRAVSCGMDKTLRVWNLAASMKLKKWRGRGYDQTLRQWNRDVEEAERILTGHTHEVRDVALTPDGRRAVSGGDDRSLRLWDLDSGRELAHAMFDANITCLAVASGNPPLVIAGDADGNVYCLELVELD